MNKKQPDQASSDPQEAAGPALSPKRAPVDRDGAYRLLYGSGTMMKDFLLGFTSESFTDRLDLSTLRRAETQHVSENLSRSANDLVWEVGTKDGESLFVTLMLEFQHRPDWTMPARMALYVSHVILELMRSDRRVKQMRRIPQVLPIVLYTGAEAWNAEMDLEGVRAVSADWAKPYDLQLRYHLVDVNRREGLPRYLRNVTDSVFRVERERTAKRLLTESKMWHRWLAGRSDEEAVRQALLIWTKAILGRKLGQQGLAPVRSLGELTEILEDEMTWREEETARADRAQAKADRAQAMADQAQAKAERAQAAVERALLAGEILGIARERFGNDLATSLKGSLRSLRSEETLRAVISWIPGCNRGDTLAARIQRAAAAERETGP